MSASALRDHEACTAGKEAVAEDLPELEVHEDRHVQGDGDERGRVDAALVGRADDQVPRLAAHLREALPDLASTRVDFRGTNVDDKYA